MTRDQIQQKIKTPQPWLHGALYNEQDLQFLSMPKNSVQPSGYSGAFAVSQSQLNENLNISKRLKARLNNSDSWNNLKRNYTFPHKAVALTSKIWSQNSKVFSAKDKHIYIEVGGEQATLNFNIEGYIKNIFFSLYKYSPNSVIVVMPNEKNVKEVFTVEVFTDNIVFLEEDNENNKVLELIYKIKDTLHVIDSEGYSRWNYTDGRLSAEPDYFGKWWADNIPATRVSTRYRDFGTNEVMNFLSTFTGDIENFFYLSSLRNIIDPYAFYYTIQKIVNQQGCNFDNGVEVCQSGYRYSVNGTALHDHTGAQKRCDSPQCKSSLSVGEVTLVPYSAISDVNNIDSVINYATPPTDSLEYAEKYLQRLRNEIFAQSTGINKDLGEQALISGKTAAEVMQSTEEQRSVLAEIKTDIEPCLLNLIKFVTEIERGANYTVSFTLGSDIMLWSKSDALEVKRLTDELGVTEILGVDEKLIELFYPNDRFGQRAAKVMLAAKRIIGDGYQAIVQQFELANDKIYTLVQGEKTIAKIVTEIITFAKTITKTTENDTKKDDDTGGGEKIG